MQTVNLFYCKSYRLFLSRVINVRSFPGRRLRGNACRAFSSLGIRKIIFRHAARAETAVVWSVISSSVSVALISTDISGSYRERESRFSGEGRSGEFDRLEHADKLALLNYWAGGVARGKCPRRAKHRLRPRYKIFRRCKKCAPVVYEWARRTEGEAKIE